MVIGPVTSYHQSTADSEKWPPTGKIAWPASRECFLSGSNSIKDYTLLDIDTDAWLFVLQLEELSSSEAHNLFDACLLQHTHRSHSDHLTAMAAQINQSHRPLTVKVFAIFISSYLDLTMESFQILSWQAGLAEEFRGNISGEILPCSTNVIPNLTAAVHELTGRNQVAMMIALLTSSRYGICDYEMEQLCRLHLCESDNSSWPTLAHLLVPFLQRVVVGGLGLLSWRDATLREQMTNTFLVVRNEAVVVHRKMLNYFWSIWQESRALLESRNWTDLASPSLAITNLRYFKIHFLFSVFDCSIFKLNFPV